jgi:alpha-tubulin suppressor-like RCC1 family protein
MKKLSKKMALVIVQLITLTILLEGCGATISPISNQNQSQSTKQQDIIASTQNNFVKISLNGSHALAIKGDGSLWTWGGNNCGQLGEGTIDRKGPHKTPKQIIPDGVQDVSAGFEFSATLKKDGSVWVWGSIETKKNDTFHLSPIKIIENGVQAITTSDNCVFALKADGSLWGLGRDDSLLQIEDHIKKTYKPKRLISSGVKAIAAGSGHILVLKTDGTLWTWGDNFWSQLGLGTKDDASYSLPMKINISNIKAIFADTANSFVIKTDGSLWAWGKNDSMKLDQSDTIRIKTPMRIMASSVKAVACSDMYIEVLKTDGSVWGWGFGAGGKRDNEYLFTYGTPIKIINEGVESIAAYGTTFAIKTDGSLWGWGSNNSGRLGYMKFEYYSQPQKIDFKVKETDSSVK